MPTGIHNIKLAELYNSANFVKLNQLLGYDINQLIKDFKNNVPGKELCLKYGIPIWKLMKVLKIESHRYGANQSPLSNEAHRILNNKIKSDKPDIALKVLQNKLLSDVYKNKSTINITGDLNCTPWLVQIYLKRHNIKTKSVVNYLHLRRSSKPQNELTKIFDSHNINHTSCWVYANTGMV